MAELVYCGVIEVTTVNERFELLQELCAQFEGAGNRPRFDERGALPALSPGLVVEHRRMHGLDERTAVAHGTKPQINAENKAVFRHVAHRLNNPFAHRAKNSLGGKLPRAPPELSPSSLSK